MAVRLHLKIGLVPAGDRLASSPDAVLHHEPSIGATSRSKGNLYGIVTVRPGSGGRAGDAAALAADTNRGGHHTDEAARCPARQIRAWTSGAARSRWATRSCSSPAT